MVLRGDFERLINRFGSCDVFVYQTQTVSWPFQSQPRDLSLPNPSWSKEMLQQYELYNSQCVGEDGKEGSGPWRRLPSYNRLLKFATGATE